MEGMSAAGMVEHFCTETLLQLFAQRRNSGPGLTGTVKPPNTQLAGIFADKFGGLFDKVFAERRGGDSDVGPG